MNSKSSLPKTPYTKIVFGKIVANELKQIVDGRKYIIVSSPSHMKNGNINHVITTLGYEPIVIIDRVPTNPSIEYLQSEIDGLKHAKFEAIIALGGGSCIDTAKVLSRCVKNNLSLKLMLSDEYKEKIWSSLPIVAIPTTAGTGSEVTSFATIWDMTKGKKYSLDGNDLYPEYALVVPKLCLTAPKKILVASAFDALAHAMESLWNINSTSISISNANMAIERIVPTLLDGNFENLSGNDVENLSLGSLYAGLAISVTRTSLSHSISYPLTYTYGLIHGIASSFTLPSIFELINELNHSIILDKFQKENLNIFLSSQNTISKIFIKHDVPIYFKEVIPRKKNVFELISKMYSPQRILNFPIQINNEKLEDILTRSLSFIFD